MRIQVIIITLLVGLGLAGCKSEQDQGVTNKVIQSIGRNHINFTDGSMITLASTPDTKIVYVIRHAEKNVNVKENPPLSPEGTARAMRLKAILTATKIDKVYSTLFTRSIMTVADIASAKAMNIEPYKPAGMAKLGRDIKADTENDRFLIVGHSNTAKSMVNVLLEENYFTDGIPEDEYDNFYVVVINSTGNKVYSLKY